MRSVCTNKQNEDTDTVDLQSEVHMEEQEQDDALVGVGARADEAWKAISGQAEEAEEVTPEETNEEVESFEEGDEKPEKDEGNEEEEENLSDVLVWDDKEYSAEQIGELIELSESERFKLFKDLPDEAFDKVTNQVTALKVAEKRNIEAKQTLEEARKIRSIYNEALDSFDVENYGLSKSVLEDIKETYPEVIDLIEEMHGVVKTYEVDTTNAMKKAEEARRDVIVDAVTSKISVFNGYTKGELIEAVKDENHELHYDVIILDNAMKTSETTAEVLSKLEKHYGKIETKTKQSITKDQQDKLKKGGKFGFKKSEGKKQSDKKTQQPESDFFKDIHQSDDKNRDILMGRAKE